MDILTWFKNEAATLKKAPVTFLGTLAIGLVGGYKYASTLNSHEIAATHADLDVCRDSVAALKEKSLAVSPAAACKQDLIIETRLDSTSVTLKVDSSSIFDQRDQYNLIMAVSVIDPMVDFVRTRNVDFSAPYTITGREMIISAPTRHLRWDHIAGPADIRATIYLLPKIASMQSIHSIADVHRVGGKYLDDKGFGVQ